MYTGCEKVDLKQVASMYFILDRHTVDLPGFFVLRLKTLWNDKDV